MPSLIDQIRAQSSGWDYNGVDTAAQLAQLLEANGITDLSQLRMRTEANPDYRAPEPGAEKYEKAAMAMIPQQRSLLTYGGQDLGWLGDVNNDGSLSKVGESKYLYTNPHVQNGSLPYDAGWSASGHGQTAFQVQPGADGSVQFSPRWDSSSQAEEARMAAMALAMAFGGPAMMSGEAGAAGAGAAAGGGATNAALIESALGTAGYGASSAGLGGAAAAGGGAIGLGGSMGAGGWAPASVVNPAIGQGIGEAVGASLGATGATGATNMALIESALGTAGYGASSAGAGGAAAAGGGGLLGGEYLSNAGMDSIGSGSLIDTGSSAIPSSNPGAITGYGSNGVTDMATGSGGGLWDSISSSAGDWFSNPQNWLKLVGAYQGYKDGKDQTQTQSRDPWGPAQPYILQNLQRGQDLQNQLQQNPFTPQQQAAYNNIGGLLNAANQNAGGLLSGYQAAASGANNYDRANPRKALQGSNIASDWQAGLLNFFPKIGGG